MKRQEIPEWDGIIEYRSPVFEEYEFDLEIAKGGGKTFDMDPTTRDGISFAALNYAREIVGDPDNSKWLERRKLTDAFKMGVEYAKRYLNGG